MSFNQNGLVAVELAFAIIFLVCFILAAYFFGVVGDRSHDLSLALQKDIAVDIEKMGNPFCIKNVSPNPFIGGLVGSGERIKLGKKLIYRTNTPCLEVDL